MNDSISRQWLMKCVNERWIKFDTEKDENRFIHLVRDIAPFAEPIDVHDRKVGKWTEKEVIHAEEAKETITEWQSCKCSVCGRYHTEPYMYYFNEPRFCSWCGARMKGGSDE